jgi:DNA replication licensing factor MCM7
MDCSKESLHDDEEKEFEPDRSVVSQIFRLIKSMSNEGGRKRRKRQKRLGRGPGGEREMDVDSDEDEDDGEELHLIDVRSRVLGAGYTEAQLNDTIAEVSL